MSITSKAHSLILQRFAKVGQTEVERQAGVDNTQLSKFCSGERGLRIDQLEPVLSALGLKIVDINSLEVDADYMRALEVISVRSLNQSMATSSGN